jgi:hypothetical protein
LIKGILQALGYQLPMMLPTGRIATIDDLLNVTEFSGKQTPALFCFWLMMNSEFSAGQHQLITGKVKNEESLSDYRALLSLKFCGKYALKKLL